MIKIIAVVGKNLELGKNNDLIWYLPNDLKFFKEQTQDTIIAMGSVTFNSLPRLLPGRHHIIISYDDNFNKDVSGCTVVYNKDDFINLLNKKSETKDVFVIGGASIYKMCIDLADEIYLTEVEEVDETADVYFPKFNKQKFNKEILYENFDKDIHYTHVVYKKKK